MSGEPVDDAMVGAWMAGRSLARGLPAPVPDHGGHRVDTGGETEAKRWVFARAGEGIAELARAIREPRHFIKLCGRVEELRALLPAGWELQAPAFFMTSSDRPIELTIPAGYRMAIQRTGPVSHARISTEAGDLAASGYAAETPDVFVYDRIVTEPDHRRRGLGRALMAALRQAKRQPDVVELLTATADGRALYETLGWRVLSDYATASLPAPATKSTSDSGPPSVGSEPFAAASPHLSAKAKSKGLP